MENQTNSNQDCGCGEGCCPPKGKKSNLWKKLLFVIIILAAGTIVAAKLVGAQNTPLAKNTPPAQNTPPAKCCTATQGSSCCPQTVKQDSVPAKCCESSEKTPCCSQSQSETETGK